MSIEEKRVLIQKIKTDPILSESEKNFQIQKLMMGNYTQKINLESSMSKTCEHYTKSCYGIYFECCGIRDPCKRCHLERGSCPGTQITIKTIICGICELEQVPSNTCTQCSIQFGTNYCPICLIWTSKEISHCDKCNICRIGTKETLYHCDNCKICFNIDSQHKCINDYTQAICAICTEDIFNSQSNGIKFENCSHLAHEKCFKKYLTQNNYKCPCCKKSIINMSSQWVAIKEAISKHPLSFGIIPIQISDIVDTSYGKFKVNLITIIDGKKMYSGEFINWNIKNNKFASGTLGPESVIKVLYKNIHCNDCWEKSKSVFHFYGIQCKHCGSFNTQE